MEKKLIVCDAGYVSIDGNTVNDVIDELRSIVKNYGDTCFVSDCEDGRLCISYERYETDEEFQMRMDLYRMREIQELPKDERLKAEYDVMKAKYGNN